MHQQSNYDNCTYWSKYFSADSCPQIYSNSNTQFVKKSSSDADNYYVLNCIFKNLGNICVQVDRTPTKSSMFSLDCSFSNIETSYDTTCIELITGSFVQIHVCGTNCTSTSINRSGTHTTGRCRLNSDDFLVTEDVSVSGDKAPSGSAVFTNRYGAISMKSVNCTNCLANRRVCYQITNEINGTSSMKFCIFSENKAINDRCLTHFNSLHFIDRCQCLNNTENGSSKYFGIFAVIKLPDQDSIATVTITNCIIKNNKGNALFSNLIRDNQIIVKDSIVENPDITQISTGVGTVSIATVSATTRYELLFDELFVGRCYEKPPIYIETCINDAYNDVLRHCNFILFCIDYN